MSEGSRPTNQDSRDTGMARENTKEEERRVRVYADGKKARGDCADGLLLPGVTDIMVEIEGKAKCHTVV